MLLKIDRCGRHVHLSTQAAQHLFYDLVVIQNDKELAIPGQYTVTPKITVHGRKGSFSDVTIIYPPRAGSYCEVSRTDAVVLGFKTEEIDNMYYSHERELLSYTWGRYVVLEYRGTYVTVPVGIQRPHIHTDDPQYKDNDVVTVVMSNPSMRLELQDVLVKKNAGVIGNILHIDNDLINAIPNAKAHIKQ